MTSLGRGEDAVSVSPEEIEPGEWTEKVCQVSNMVRRKAVFPGKTFVIPPRGNRKVPRDFDKTSTTHAPHREFLLRTQAIPRHRHSLR
jgi:hypothetical protein